MRSFALVLLVSFCVPVLASIDDQVELLRRNRIPKEPHAEFGSVCSECQTLVQRIVVVAKDPAKLAELKLLLSALCHETSYEEECKMFVSRLDLFIEKLLPYLKDSHKVCTDIHLCKNSKLDMFHRIGMLYAKKYVNQANGGLICDECQFAARELQQLVDNKDTEIQAKKFLSENVCKKMGQYQGSCDILVDDFLPEVFQELHTLFNDPKEFCEHVRLCNPSALSQPPTQNLAALGSFKALMARINGVRSHGNMGCLECKILAGTVLAYVKREENVKRLAEELRGLVCAHLPATWSDGCNDFVAFYGKTVIHMIVHQVTIEKACIAVHACSDKHPSHLMGTTEETMNDCQVCQHFSKQLLVELSEAEVQQNLVHEASTVTCEKSPVFSELCHKFSSGIVTAEYELVKSYIEKDQFCTLLQQC